MLQRLYGRMMEYSGRKSARIVLFAVAFTESSIFPIPPDLLLIPMVLAKRAAAWTLAALCTVASVMGGLAGYLLGMLLFVQIAQPLLEMYDYADQFADISRQFDRHGAWIVFVGALTPFPYKVITIAGGAAGIDIIIFTLSSLLARGLRYFIIAGLLYIFGASIRQFIERRLGIIFAAVTAAVIIGLWLIGVYGS